jgi:hypothetical protein
MQSHRGAGSIYLPCHTDPTYRQRKQSAVWWICFGVVAEIRGLATGNSRASSRYVHGAMNPYQPPQATTAPYRDWGRHVVLWLASFVVFYFTVSGLRIAASLLGMFD